MPNIDPGQNTLLSAEKRPTYLANADYDAGGITLDETQHLVYTTPGAAGALGIILPKVNRCPFGSLYVIWHFGTTNNTTVDDQNDGIVPVGQSVLTADKDVVTFMALGDHWKLIEDVTT